MTRINLTDVTLLCDQQLRAEHREMKRIPNNLAKGKYRLDRELPANYTVRTNDNPEGGKGHESFFINKLAFLKNRYCDLMNEIHSRGFEASDMWNKDVTEETFPEFWNDYVPSQEAIDLNMKRIFEMKPKQPRYYSEVDNDLFDFYFKPN